MKLNIFIYIILTLLVSCSISNKVLVEEPNYKKNETYVKHFAYSLVYNDSVKQPKWVAYKLNSYQIKPKFKRTNKFLIDTLISSGTATNKDYYKSGFDKGHLAPAADMTWNKLAMKESFYFSNITPQRPKFNRGIWKKLEIKVRKWATIYDSIYVCTGPIFINSESYIGKNRVKVPTHFYKVLLIYNDSIKQSIGFIFPNEKCKNDLFSYKSTVDSIENLLDIDLYHSLPNRYEKKIESKIDLSYWK
jgi:endonuclease G